MNILVTGGAGFIGSALVRFLLQETQNAVLNVDKLTYAGNLQSLGVLSQHPRYQFVQQDICDQSAVFRLMQQFKPQIVIHLAAESHVDRSIDGPAEFIHTNVVGTFSLLQASRQYYMALTPAEQKLFRFHHVSTEEVFGDLKFSADLFTENTPYAPSSPYSATKAASDHLVRAWYRTYGLPVVISNCSNNYGPCQFPEKLIPLMILNALAGKPLPVYGDGQQVRDWLFVEDHARALYLVATQGVAGQSYNIGGHNEKTNLEVVEKICALLEELVTEKPAGVGRFRDLIAFVTDRPGHDVRYAIDAGKIQRELNWTPAETFDSGLRKTVQWYLTNVQWWQGILSGRYRLQRLGATTDLRSED